MYAIDALYLDKASIRSGTCIYIYISIPYMHDIYLLKHRVLSFLLFLKIPSRLASILQDCVNQRIRTLPVERATDPAARLVYRTHLIEYLVGAGVSEGRIVPAG